MIQTKNSICMKYKHIVVDIDGALIDTEYVVLHSLQETIRGLSPQRQGKNLSVISMLVTVENIKKQDSNIFCR